MESRVIYASLTYLLVLAILVHVFKAQVYDPRFFSRPFGVGDGRTLLPVYLLVPFLALVIFFAFTMIELIRF